MQIKPLQQDKEIEKAILMLVLCVRQKCRNAKPLILHSLRVGFKLLEIGQPKEVVIAGVLHDLIEDTDCKISKIKKEFGLKVANLVLALTREHVEGYEDYIKQRKIFIIKIKKAGKRAMIIKIVDANDNLLYVPLIKNNKILKEVLWKHRLVMKEFKADIGDLDIFKEYCQKYKMIVKETIFKIKK